MKSLIFYCGHFGVFDDFTEPELSLDKKFITNNTSIFFVRASGDSMSPLIMDKDILIVDTSLKIEKGQLGTFFLNQAPLCKQFDLIKNKRILKSINQSYEDIVIQENDELDLFGVVIGLARDFNE